MPLSSSCLIRTSKKTTSSCHQLRLQSRERWLLSHTSFALSQYGPTSRVSARCGQTRQVGRENLRFRLQLRLSQPRISASSRGRRSERRDSPSFSLP
ncbi:hypothetical protein CesoFtcFv8_009951 [Champsocephalus esox]|uniref:Uncharacterized protein n=1 Tax=Champsocephalus esox TaxID=159716 RepID=A0AAN8H2B2_9TELE|nr:hypothetical protein CesoFtcFv8_009951 [Champsocephalus esox]